MDKYGICLDPVESPYKFKIFLFFVLILSCFLGLFSMAQEENSKTFQRIEILGNKRIEKEAILEKMKLKPGSRLTPGALRDDLRSIFSLGFFEDLQFDLEGDTLKITVKERPVIVAIEYEGSEEFEKKDLEEASKLRLFHVVNLSKIKEAQAAITKKYEEKGYYLAQTTFELIPVENRPGEVKLVFRIQENEKVKIRKIFFLGNKVISSAELKQVMATSEGHTFSWATQGGTYRESIFERDLALLAFYYGNQGYIEAKFSKPRVTLSEDRRYVDILLDVEEGRQFFLGNVTFRGDDLLFTEEDLKASFEMKEGEVFSTGKLQEQVMKLTDKYGDEGYAFANVIPKTFIREGTQIVDLQFEIERGEKVYWGQIKITGNSKTHDKVIRRELRFHEGELYNATKRKKSVERVKRLGFFGDVNFLTSSPKGTTNVLDLEIKVTEKPTGSLNVSAGYGSASGFIFQASVNQANLFGRGQQISLEAMLNESQQRVIRFGFTEPKIFDSEWLTGFDIYYERNPVGFDPVTYVQRTLGSSFRVGREIFENVNLYSTYRRETYHLRDPVSLDIFTDKEKDQKGYISSVALTLDYDTRNNRLDPSAGLYLSGSSELAGLGGRVFQKFSLRARFYRKVFWKLVYRSNYEYGVLANWLTDETVPDSERFRVGGIYPSPLRGYPGGTVGTSKKLVNTRDIGASPLPFDYVIGGTHKLLINHELEFPLIPEADIRAALFFDAGNAYDTLSGSSPALLTNYGWGLRWYSPLGPLRFEWGYPLTRRSLKGDTSPEFHFIIAPTF